MMLFRNFFAELDRRRETPFPAQLDRSHFWDASDPLEARLAEAISEFPQDELGLLIMSFGLDGQDPRAPHVVADALGMALLKVLDTDTAARVRLRNKAETRVLIEAIAGEEVPDLARHLEAISAMPDEKNRSAATDLWFFSRRPLRRLALSTVLEGGFAAFQALVRQHYEPSAVAKDCGHQSALADAAHVRPSTSPQRSGQTTVPASRA